MYIQDSPDALSHDDLPFSISLPNSQAFLRKCTGLAQQRPLNLSYMVNHFISSSLLSMSRIETPTN
jgi:hypothetical protein